MRLKCQLSALFWECLHPHQRKIEAFFYLYTPKHKVIGLSLLKLHKFLIFICWSFAHYNCLKSVAQKHQQTLCDALLSLYCSQVVIRVNHIISCTEVRYLRYSGPHQSIISHCLAIKNKVKIVLKLENKKYVYKGLRVPHTQAPTRLIVGTNPIVTASCQTQCASVAQKDLFYLVM